MVSSDFLSDRSSFRSTENNKKIYLTTRVKRNIIPVLSQQNEG